MRIALLTYGNRREQYPENSVILVNRGIRDGIVADPDLTLLDLSPPLNGMHVDRQAASVAWKKLPSEVDAIVAQACYARDVFLYAQNICPSAVRILHRESTHANDYRTVMHNEMARRKIKYPLHYDGGSLLERELEEYDLADRITVVSHHVRNSFIREGTEPKKLIHIGPQIVEIHRYRRAPRRARRPFIFLHLAQLGLRKGTLDLLDAWELADPPAELHVYGLAEHRAVEKRVMERMRELPRVDYKGQHPFITLPAVYRTGHAVVQPSHEEGASMVPFEAMASGLPVIATRSVGCDVLEHDVNGYLVREGDVRSIAKAMAVYVSDEKIRYRHAQAAFGSIHGCHPREYGRRYAAGIRQAVAEVRG